MPCGMSPPWQLDQNQLASDDLGAVHFRRLATRYDRRAIHDMAFMHLTAIMLWLRRMWIRPGAASLNTASKLIR
ncbi:hypothetical protein GCM10028812_23270 [Ancylobacter sonchi]